jgi:flavin reductase (DIM6/NTAB) family NADH-FMN oxidoreductase RutF
MDSGPDAETDADSPDCSRGLSFDPADRDPDDVYRLLTSVVVPRPVGWISTRSPAGVDNLAPYSYFNVVSSAPPVVLFSSGGTGEDRKDTPENAIETGEFVWNLVTEPLAAAMDETSAPLPPGESEFDAAGVERAPADAVTPPRVAGAAAAFECTLYDSFQVYDNTVVLGEAVRVHVDESLLSDGAVDAAAVDAVGRLGGPYYTRIDRLDLERGH